MEAIIEFIPIVLTLLLGLLIGAGIGLTIRHFANKNKKLDKRIKVKKR